jgi:hypothetical protein
VVSAGRMSSLSRRPWQQIGQLIPMQLLADGCVCVLALACVCVWLAGQALFSCRNEVPALPHIHTNASLTRGPSDFILVSV